MHKEEHWLLTEKYQGVESEAFHADCARLAAGEPLGYLIGHVPFLDCTMYLDSHPLIPRPETEYWTEKAITEILTHTASSPNLRDDIPKILDLCAGSGAIGVAVAKAVPQASVTLAEIDPSHLPTIQKNLQINTSIYGSIKIEPPIVIFSNLFSNIATGTTFDYILSNPPYIDAAANTVDTNVAKNEPHLALFGGVNGMEIITKIIVDAPTYLTPTGQLWLEHEPAQVEVIAALARQAGFTVVTHPDQYQVPRFSVLTMAE